MFFVEIDPFKAAVITFGAGIIRPSKDRLKDIEGYFILDGRRR